MSFQIDQTIMEKANILLNERLKHNPSRIRHLYASADTARDLAIQINENPKEAYFSALLHDLGKGADHDFALAKFKEYKIYDPFLLQNPELGHGDLSAILTYEHFRSEGLEYQSDIINSMRFHTFGRAGMSNLEKIVYVADLIEPNRAYPRVEILRQEVKNDFEKGIYALCADNFKFLLSKKIVIHPNALEMLNDLTRNMI